MYSYLQDYPEIYDIHPAGASFFFWSFIILMFLLVLNVSAC
jgi:hypothetical protein